MAWPRASTFAKVSRRATLRCCGWTVGVLVGLDVLVGWVMLEVPPVDAVSVAA